MSPMSDVQGENLCRSLEAVRSLRRYRCRGASKPHKLVLLLAVVDLFEEGLVYDNRIYLNKELEDRFRFYFRMVAGPKDWCQIGPPFYHLRSSGFWFHHVYPSRVSSYYAMRTPGGGKGNVMRNIEYAYLAQFMLDVMKDSTSRQLLRNAIVDLLLQETSNPQAYRLRTVRYKDEQCGYV